MIGDVESESDTSEDTPGTSSYVRGRVIDHIVSGRGGRKIDGRNERNVSF